MAIDYFGIAFATTVTTGGIIGYLKARKWKIIVSLLINMHYGNAQLKAYFTITYYNNH